MKHTRQLQLVLASAVVAALGTGAAIVAQGVLPNPYRNVDGWAKLPGGRAMGAVGSVKIDPDGRSVWAVIRCEPQADPARFGDECRDSKTDSVYKFDADGNVVKSFGGGMFIWPHGLAVDAEGNVYVTDAVDPDRAPKGDKRGQQVVKFSPEGKVLLTFGMAGMAGSATDHLNAPSDVAIAANGDIFIADGHGETGNNRVMKFSKDGKFVRTWGKTGYGPSEFRTLHAIAIDSRGRVFVGDRGNNRIQLFDQDGKYINTWTQFGKPSGIFFDNKDQIFVADSESDDVQNPGWEMGIRIGDAKLGWQTGFVGYAWADPRNTTGNGAEFVAVDRDGNMYGGEPRPRRLQKVRPGEAVGARPSIGVLLTLAVLWAAGVGRAAQYVGPPAPEQPLPFSHKKHLALKLQCQGCHEIAAPGLQAGIPPTSTCMGCHIKVKRDSPFIQQLTTSYKNKEAIPWVRVYQLPDFVSFSHETHVTAGKLACDTCHGPVQDMDAVRKVSDISMGACIACHQERRMAMTCSFCHEPNPSR